MSNVEIELGTDSEKLVIDGQDITHSVYGFTLTADARTRTQRLVLDVAAPETTKFGSPHVTVLVDDSVLRILERAGWAPPPGTDSLLVRDENGCPCEYKEIGWPGQEKKILGRSVPTCPIHGSTR